MPVNVTSDGIQESDVFNSMALYSCLRRLASTLAENKLDLSLPRASAFQRS